MERRRREKGCEGGSGEGEGSGWRGEKWGGGEKRRRKVRIGIKERRREDRNLCEKLNSGKGRVRAERVKETGRLVRRDIRPGAKKVSATGEVGWNGNRGEGRKSEDCKKTKLTAKHNPPKSRGSRKISARNR